jgi:protein involved in polysaccharide export with SLBB domain
MQTVSIPRELTQKGDLIVIPRKEYEELLRTQKKHKKFNTELDRDLDKAVKDYKAGRYYGPFKSAEDGRQFLESRRTKKK